MSKIPTEDALPPYQYVPAYRNIDIVHGYRRRNKKLKNNKNLMPGEGSIQELRILLSYSEDFLRACWISANDLPLVSGTAKYTKKIPAALTKAKKAKLAYTP